MSYNDWKVKFTNPDWTEVLRQSVECYTRVMGYCRPVSQFNKGKKSEFYSRKYFAEEATDNSKFIQTYS